MVDLITHRIRRQRWLCSAGSPAEAFALRGSLREAQEAAVPAAFERAFDATLPGGEVVRLPRLELRIRLASVDDLAATLPELLARAVSEQLGRLLAPRFASPARLDGAAPALAADGPATAGTRSSGRESLLAGLITYLATGALPWELAQAEASALLERFRKTASEDLAAVLARAPDAQTPLPRRLAFFFRLLQLLPVERWQEIAWHLSPSLPVAQAAALGRALTALASQTSPSGAVPGTLTPDIRRRIAAAALAAGRGPAGGLTEAFAEALGGVAPSDVPSLLATLVANLHCRDAPWGVSEAVASASQSPTSRGRAVEGGDHAAAGRGPADGLTEALAQALGGAAPSDVPSRLATPAANPHCRDAPWGVSEAVASASQSPRPRERAVEGGNHAAAVETPYGASPQWGSTSEAPSQPAAADLAPFPIAETAEETFPAAVRCAGLVLLHPFLPKLFESAGLLRDGEPGLPWAELPRAAALLHWLATGRDEVLEFELGFVKVLLGRRPEEPLLVDGGALTAADREEGETLLQAAISHWRALKSTTAAGLRASFLQRGGLLREDDAGWRLQVEPAAFDLLLDQLPWGIGVVKLPWMTQPIFTEWPTS